MTQTAVSNSALTEPAATEPAAAEPAAAEPGASEPAGSALASAVGSLSSAARLRWGAVRRNRTAQFFLWSGLIAFGARRGGLLGLAALGYGLDRMSQLALGTAFSQMFVQAARDNSPRRFGEGTRDLVDEASWESFPASDPPGRGVG